MEAGAVGAADDDTLAGDVEVRSVTQAAGLDQLVMEASSRMTVQNHYVH